MSRQFNNEFPQSYIENVFSVWELYDHPNMNKLFDLIDPTEDGNKPAPTTLSAWKVKYGWEDRAESIQVKVQEQTDRELVQVRMEMMQRHAERARAIGDKAWKYLDTVGFDSSASAVSAAFKAFEEEKKSTGMGIALSQVFSMSDEDLQKAMNRLLLRAEGLDAEDTVEGEQEDLNATSNTQTSDE